MSDSKSNMPPSGTFYTTLGFISIFFWSASVVLSRTLTTALGKYTAGAAIYLIGGLIACLVVAFRPNDFRRMLSLPLKYYLICGSLFTAYMILLYVAIGLATNNQATIIVGLINYFWPAFIFLFSIPILGRKANWLLLPGMIIALFGVYLAAIDNGSLSFSELIALHQANIIPYAAALAAAVCWGLYSNYCQTLLSKEDVGAVPLFMLITGFFLLLFRLNVQEESNWSTNTVLIVSATVLFPVILAYSFWDLSMRRGNAVLVSAASYFTPVLSTVLTSFFLKAPVENKTWLGCAFVTLGAIMCKFAFPKIK